MFAYLTSILKIVRGTTVRNCRNKTDKKDKILKKIQSYCRNMYLTIHMIYCTLITVFAFLPFILKTIIDKEISRKRLTIVCQLY